MMNKNLIYILLLFFSVFSYAQQSPNYLINNGFENWNGSLLQGWTLENNYTNGAVQSTIASNQSTTSSLSSSTSVTFTTLSNNKGLLALEEDLIVSQPGRYFFGAWVKAESAGSIIKMGFKYKDDSSGASYSYTASQFTLADTDWHYIVRFLDFDVGNVINIRFIPTGASIFYIDNAKLYQGNANSNVEWDIVNGTSRDYSFFFAHQSYAGGNYGSLSLESNSSNVYEGANSLKYETTADASTSNRGALTFKDNGTIKIRYEHPSSTARDYQMSAWVMSPTNATVKVNLKVGSDNHYSSTDILAGEWTNIYSAIATTTSTTTSGSKIYPILQFTSPDTTYYIDNYYLNWAPSGINLFNVVNSFGSPSSSAGNQLNIFGKIGTGNSFVNKNGKVISY